MRAGGPGALGGAPDLVADAGDGDTPMRAERLTPGIAMPMPPLCEVRAIPPGTSQGVQNVAERFSGV